MDRCLDEDIAILGNRWDLLGALSGKHVLITGGTGLIGRMLTNTLCYFEEKHHTGMRIHALVRDVNKAEKLLGPSSGGLRLIPGNVDLPLEVPAQIEYIIHTASITSSKAFVEQPVETISTLIGGTKNVLELARQKRVEKMVYLSSMEVYGIPEQQTRVAEDDIGHIDFTAIRSSYSEGKRLAECLCNAYRSEYGVPAVTVRLCQTFGPGVSDHDGRVFAQFARSVMEGNDIRLNTSGRTFRNYCYLRDAAAAIFTVLTRGEPGQAYNVANPDTGISIADMAQMVCREFGQGRSKVVFTNPDSLSRYGYNPEMHLELATEKLETLGWHAEVGLKEMFERMLHDMKMDQYREGSCM